MKKLGILAMVLLVVMAMAASLTAVAFAAAGSQTWKLDSTASGDPSCAALTMYRVGGTNSPPYVVGGGPISILAGSSATWVADEASLPAGGVTFPDGTGSCPWIIEVYTDTNWIPFCVVEIGYVDANCNWNPIFTEPGDTLWIPAGPGKHDILQLEEQTASATVPQGDYLALRITNTSGADRNVYTNNCSNLQSPCEDPGYPFPEIAAGVLFGMGFIGLVGFLGIKWLKGKRQETV